MARAAASWLFIVALLCHGVSIAEAADAHRPAPHTAVYTVKTGGVVAGKMTRRLEIDEGDRYRFHSVIEAEGLLALLKPTRIVEESGGQWTGTHPKTERYLHDKKSGKKHKLTVVEFDWAAGQTHATINGTPVDAALAPGALDKLSYQLALMRDLAAGVETLVYDVADAGGGKRYALERGAGVRVKAAGRAFETVPVSYSRSDGRRTVLWCAPALGYLPVRIEYTEKDGAVTTAELLPGSSP